MIIKEIILWARICFASKSKVVLILVFALSFSGTIKAQTENLFGISLPDELSRSKLSVAQAGELAPGTDTPYTVAVQPDGKLVLAGIISPEAPTPSDFAVLRYNGKSVGASLRTARD